MAAPRTVARFISVTLALTATLTACSSGNGTTENPGVDALTWRAPLWVELLGGEGTHPFDNQGTVTRLNDPASSDLGAEQAQRASETARAWLTAEVTGLNRDAFAGYWPDGDGTRSGQLPPGSGCTDVNISVVNPQRIPSASGQGPWVKVLLGWTAQCPVVNRSAPQITFTYLREDPDGFAVVRPARVPSAAPVEIAGVVPEWALADLGSCADDGLQARLEVAQAWKVLCSDAQAAGVDLRANAAWRSATQQSDLYAEAVEIYGAEEARRRIAVADDRTCTSAHCSGIAIDVPADSPALTWLRDTVLCTDLTGTFTPATDGACPANLYPVPRLTRYGFTTPLTSSPGHLEWSLPLQPLDRSPTTCSAPTGATPADVIVAVWQCRLLTAGYPSDAIPDIVARALVVARCESGMDPSYQAFGGRFADRPHPDTGAPYESTGLFGLTSGWNEALLGTDPQWWDAEQGARAGVERFLDDWTYGRDPWLGFGCVVGDGIRPGGLLPERGGPALPTWAAILARP